MNETHVNSHIVLAAWTPPSCTMKYFLMYVYHEAGCRECKKE